MNEPDWLWDPPMGIPEAEDFGPALDEAAIAAWEQRQGVQLPPILRRAYTQQDGGRVRDCSFGAALFRLRDVEPLDVAELDTSGCDGKLDGGRVFNIGYDDTGSNLLLHFRDDGRPPPVYAYYFDGGDMHVWGETVDALWTQYKPDPPKGGTDGRA